MIECATVVRPRVCVAIPTYRRQSQLARLLGGIARQKFPAEYAVEVLVLDNDAQPTAATDVARIAACFPVSLAYRHAPEPGLSAVRNAALAYARDDFDFVAMIDDDEDPEAEWLGELLAVAARTQADVAIGPVRYIVPAGTPRWLRDGGFFSTPTYPDGAEIKAGYSGNCLLRTASLRRLGVTFDRAFDFAGGEDLLFFRQLRARGATLVFAAQALASECVTPERLSAGYVLKLNYRRGNTLALCDARLNPGFGGAALRAVKGFGRLLRGAARAVPLSLVRGRRGALVAACDVAHGSGSLAGLFGFVYEAYGRVDARV